MEYNTVAEAQSVFEKPENIEINGRVLYIDYSTSQEVKTETPSKTFELKYICLDFMCISLNTVNTEDVSTVRRGHSEPSLTLFVQNLLFETTEDDLKAAFDGCVKAKIAVHQATGRSRG